MNASNTALQGIPGGDERARREEQERGGQKQAGVDNTGKGERHDGQDKQGKQGKQGKQDVVSGARRMSREEAERIPPDHDPDDPVSS